MDRVTDSINTYVAVRKPLLPAPVRSNERYSPLPTQRDYDDGIRFQHRYGDGIEVCIAKALEALHRQKPITEF